MKPRTVICVLTIVFMLAYTVPSTNTFSATEDGLPTAAYSARPVGYAGLAQAAGNGDSTDSTALLSRTLTGQQLDILNTYATPTAHNVGLDLSSYLLPGWTLYRVNMTLQSLTARPERRVAGVADQIGTFAILKDTSDLVQNQLAQGFYRRPHDGLLLNYSLYYTSPTYDPSSYGTAYFVVRLSPSSSNMTNPVPISNNGGTATWVTVSDTATLSANTQYLVAIDGSALTMSGEDYPVIRWRSETVAGAFDSYIYNMNASSWVLYNNREAMLRYTYTPWNTTSDSALTFSGPEPVALRGNSTALSGSAWSFSSTSGNVTLLQFDSNQSVAVGYSMTLWYSKPVTTYAIWHVAATGQAVTWNQTLSLSYPSVPTGTVARFANLTRMIDWSPTGLYAGTSQTNHDSYLASGKTVTCALMTSGTWTMVYSGYNYAVSINALESVDISGSLTITSLFQDALSQGVTTGSSNLTVWRGSTMVHNPANTTTPGGNRVYEWDVDFDATVNGVHRIEVFWSNGTEAGYRSANTVVYYPTELSTSTPGVSAFTDSSFGIRVHYNDTYTPQGLAGAVADVTYSFDGGPSIAMTDQPNGTWTAVVSTVGKIAGSYVVDVSASGWALQNRTLQIPVTLTYDTQSLSVGWSDGNSITYIESTTLYVFYRFDNGTLVPNAMLNVADGITVWPLSWSPSSGTYNYTFHGSDGLPGLGTHSLTVNAWKAGHESQVDSSQTLVISEEPTFLVFDWTTTTIDWTQNVVFTVNYTDSHGALIAGATQRQFGVNGTMYVLVDSSGVYSYTVNNLLDLGYHTVLVNISKFGYEYAYYSAIDFTIIEASTLLVVTWFPANVTIDYTQSLNLTVDYTHEGYDVPGALVNVTINGHFYPLVFSLTEWTVSIPGEDLNIGVYQALISAWSYGYALSYNTTYNMNITLAANSFVVTWPSDMDMDYTEWLNLTVYYTYSYQPVPDAYVRLVIDGTRIYNMSYTGGTWQYNLSCVEADLGTLNITVIAESTGYDTGVSQRVLLVSKATYTTYGVDILYFGYDNAVLYHDGWVEVRPYCMNSTGAPLTGISANVTIDSIEYVMLDLGNGTYLYNVTGFDLGVGSHVCFINLTSHGYFPRIHPFDLQVEVVPTHIDTSIIVPTTMYLNQTVIILVDYINNHTGGPIPSGPPVVSWSSSIIETEFVSTGRYRIELSSYGLLLGDHELSITFAHANFMTRQLIQPITVRAVHTSFVAQALSDTYEYEYVWLRVTYLDLDHGVPIHWASVNATIQGSTYQLQYVGDGVYAYHFNVTIAPSITYTVEYATSAYGCDSGATSALLEVLSKGHTYISIDSSSLTPIQDEISVLKAYIRRNITETPVNGVTLTFVIITQLQNGTIWITILSDVTDAEGYASQAFKVDFEAAYLTFFVIYEGAETLWRAVSSSGLLVVQRLSVLTLIVRIFSQPIVLMTLAVIVGLVVAARAYNRSSKPKKAKARRTLEDQMRAFRDLTTLRHFMAVYLHRGTCVFYHPFAEQRIQPDLISGFIAAVTSVYGEIKGDGVQGTLEEIHYHGLRLNSYSGKYVIGILILEGEMTAYLRECLQAFIDSFETRYATDLDEWTGVTDCFDNAWIVGSLYDAFGYTRLLPHTISRGRRPKGFDAIVYKTIQQLMGSQKEFLCADMLVPVAKKVGKTEVEVLDSLVRLAQLEAVTPIDTSVAIARQVVTTTPTHPPSEERLVSEEVEVTAARIGETPQVAPVPEEARPPEEATTSEARPAEESPSPATPAAPPLSDADRFLMEVESLLLKKAEEAKPDKKVDEADEFVKDVESLLTDEKEKKRKTRRKPASE